MGTKNNNYFENRFLITSFFWCSTFCLVFWKNVIENILNYLCFNSSFNWLLEDVMISRIFFAVPFRDFFFYYYSKEKHLFLFCWMNITSFVALANCPDACSDWDEHYVDRLLSQRRVGILSVLAMCQRVNDFFLNCKCAHEKWRSHVLTWIWKKW